MAKATEITVQVNAKLDVDEKTAHTCLKLVEIFINKAGLVVLPILNQEGEVELVFFRNTTRKAHLPHVRCKYGRRKFR